MTREEMMDAVINKFGFEAKETINFCILAETADLVAIKKQYDKLMKK